MRDPLDLVGSTVGDEYRVIDIVSHGDLSLIYRAQSLVDGKHLALKCYVGLSDLPEPARSVFRANFRHIGRLVGLLSQTYEGHLSVHRTGTVRVPPHREVPAMLLEWLEGTTMEALLDRDRDNGFITRSPEEALAIMRAPMAALAAAHDYGLVHRNIKPGKLFVCGGALVAPTVVKLLDFSLAKFGHAPNEQVSILTPEYAAPEQFWGDEASIGPWTDVFSLALVSVELMLGGRPALRGNDLAELRTASENRHERPTPRSHGLELPNAIESVFKRALAVEPRDRFPHAGDFLSALERAITCEGRLTSTHISRVSGVLDYHPTEDTTKRRNHLHTPAHGIPLVDAQGRLASVRVTPLEGDTLVSPTPARTGHTVLAPAPDFE